MHPNIIKSAGIITGLIIFSLGLVLIAAAAGTGKPASQSKASVPAPVSPAGVKSAKVIAPSTSVPSQPAAENVVPPVSAPPSFAEQSKKTLPEESTQVIQPTPQGRIVINPEEEKTQTLTLKKKLEQKGSFKFSNEDLRIVLRSLAKAYRFNITLAPEVQGKVTVDFHDVKVVSALDIILKDQGFGYQITGDILRVTTLDKLKQEEEAQALRNEAATKTQVAEAAKRKAQEEAEPLEIKVYDLKFIDASNVMQALFGMAPGTVTVVKGQGMLSPRGRATVLTTKQYKGFTWEKLSSAEQAKKSKLEFARSKILIVQDTPTVLAKITQVIEEIDIKPQQIMIDAKIIEVPLDLESRLGINWTNALNQWQVGAQDLTAILTKGYSKNHEMKDSRTWGDSRQNELNRNISNEYTDTRTDTSNRNDKFTLDKTSTGWNQTLHNENESTRKAVQESIYHDLDEDKTTNLTSYISNVSDTLTKLSTAGQAYSAILSAADFNLMISAMKTDSNVVVLSNPRVIVQENYAAEINIGRKWPILKTEVSDQGGTGGFSIDYWQDIGIILKVIPQVRDNGRGGKDVNMIVHPAVSTNPEVIQAGAGSYVTEYPIIALREADTNVTIADGDTMVIGGLISSENRDEEFKIPLLGDIPILGYLFKEKHKKLNKTNLLIFVTAKIMDTDAQLSNYERMMLEKAPPDALEDVRFQKDEDLRPFLYRKSRKARPTPPGPLPKSGRKETKAMKRSLNR